MLEEQSYELVLESIMAKNPDYLAKSIQKHAAPFLRDSGFAKRSGKNYYRLRKHLVDGILFSKSSWGGGFYLHYFVNPVFSLRGRLLSSYTVGERLDQSPDGLLWTAGSQEDSDRSLQSALNCVATTILPWFGTIPSIERYLEMLQRIGDTAFRGDEITCLCALGRIDEALSLCESLREYFIAKGDIDAVTERYFTYYDELAVAAKEGAVCDHLLRLVRRNLAEAKIVLPE